MLRLSLITIEELARGGDKEACAAKAEWNLLSELASEEVRVYAYRTSSGKIDVHLGLRERTTCHEEVHQRSSGERLVSLCRRLADEAHGSGDEGCEAEQSSA